HGGRGSTLTPRWHDREHSHVRPPAVFQPDGHTAPRETLRVGDTGRFSGLSRQPHPIGERPEARLGGRNHDRMVRSAGRAVLDATHASPSNPEPSFVPHMMFMFWTACPEAPFMR